MSGQNVNPATLDDEEIKLLAIQGIQNTDPERAIPLLEGVLNATNSLKVKQQALYVLALSDRPQAHQILMKYAKGGGTPDLQRSAISYIASRRDKQTTAADLNEIYTSTQDQGVRIAIFSAYRAAGDKPALIAIAGNTSTPVDVRSVAISNLSGLAAPADLWTLYQKETNADLKMRMISAFSSMRAVDQLSQIAKTEKDPAIRQRAIRALGSQKVEQTGPMLVDLYGSTQDVETRKAVISALSAQNNAEGLVGIARKEASLELKRDIVARISNLAANGKSKVAADYLMEIIK
jgi:HEAT repeat protein